MWIVQFWVMHCHLFNRETFLELIKRKNWISYIYAVVEISVPVHFIKLAVNYIIFSFAMAENVGDGKNTI